MIVRSTFCAVQGLRGVLEGHCGLHSQCWGDRGKYQSIIRCWLHCFHGYGCYLRHTPSMCPPQRTMPPLQMRKHPDNDITIINCNRCGCPPHAHVILVAQQQQEAGDIEYIILMHDKPCWHTERGRYEMVRNMICWSWMALPEPVTAKGFVHASAQSKHTVCSGTLACRHMCHIPSP